MTEEIRQGILVSVTPDRPAAAVVIRQPLPAPANRSRRLRLSAPAWLASGVIHLLLLLLFLQVDFATGLDQPINLESVIIDTKVEDPDKPANLENDEVGLDPAVPTNFNVDRIETVSVPGLINANEAVGLLNAPEAPPRVVPPPPGFGDNSGQGGGVDSLLGGKGNPIGFAGGLGGLKMIPGGFGGRSGATREQMLREGGGNTASEAAVSRGLKWMALHQAPDGHWSLDGFARDGHCHCEGPGQANDVAGTAFGLLPMLGAGHTHRPGNDKANPYVKNIERGLRFLLSQQNPEGAFNGDQYANGLATIAICEAYSMTSDPQLKGPGQRALDFIARAQNDLGGWDYTPRGPMPDTSIGVWQIMALKSGQMGGLSVPPKTLAAATRWLNDWAADAEGSIYGYRQARGRNPEEGGASPQTMVATGLLCRQYLGWGPRVGGLVKGAKWFMRPENMPLPTNRQHMYFWYYGTQVLHHLGGAYWEKWNPLMRDLLIRTQDQGLDSRHAHQRGSWNPTGDWWCSYGGRVMMTSMCLLTLEVYYRHLPLYRREMGGNK